MSTIIEITIRVGFAILVTISALTFFWKYKRYLETESDKRKEALKFFLGLVLILIPIFEPIVQSTKLPPDYFRLNKPYLEVALVIDDVTPRSLDFHFKIKNLGRLPAENISYNIYSNTSSSYELKPVYKRELAPGGKMRYSPDFKIFLKGEQKLILVELGVFYAAFVNDVENNYKILFQYRLKSSDLRKGSYGYDSKSEEVGVKPEINLEFIAKHTDKILEGPEGAFAFSFDEKDQHENGISSFYSSPTKEILYDPENKLIVFKIKIDGRVLVLRKSYYKPGIKFHNVALGWNTGQKDFFLSVDGQ